MSPHGEGLLQDQRAELIVFRHENAQWRRGREWQWSSLTGQHPLSKLHASVRRPAFNVTVPVLNTGVSRIRVPPSAFVTPSDPVSPLLTVSVEPALM